MSRPIVVINPNSNTAVTEAISASLDGFRREGGPGIDCVTLAEGPFGIESQADVDSVALPLARLVDARAEAAAVVIACYSDPGLDICRETARVPVYGIQECGVLTALATADLFGVIALSPVSVARHRRYMRRMGVLGRLAGERPAGLTVDESARGAQAFDNLRRTAEQLISDGAGVIVLGCAGMARHRAPLEAALGMPVIDPTQAAVAIAVGRLAARAS